MYFPSLPSTSTDDLSNEEIKTIIQESSNKITENYEEMVLNLLDLQKVSVENAMIPKNDIKGLDINESEENINSKLIFKHFYTNGNVKLYTGPCQKVLCQYMVNL